MKTADIMENKTERISNREGKYLTFSLAGEEYGTSILKIKEIIGIITIRPVPQMPAYVKGVINLRGKVIPIIDLRVKFGMPSAEYTDRTCIIITEIKKDNGQILVGFLVDAVSEVLNIKENDIEDTPNFGTRLNTDFLLGMAKTGDSVKILLDIDRVMNLNEVNALEQAA